MNMIVKSRKIVYFILLLMPFVDMLTGYALNSKNGGFLAFTGQIYRMGAFIYMFYMLFSHKFNKKLLWLLLFTIYAMLLVCVDAIRFSGSILENLSSTIKLLFPIYLVYCLINVSKNDKELIKCIINNFSWIYPLSFIIPKVLGIGYYLGGYAFNSGYKSFYYATNEQNVILMVLFVYAFQNLYEDLTYSNGDIGSVKFNIMNLIKLIFIIISLILIGSKTSFLAIGVVCLLYLLHGDKIKVKLKFIGTFVSIGLIAAILISQVLKEQLENITHRIIYTYSRYVTAEGGLLTFALSKRNLRIAPAVEYWYSNGWKGMLNFIFGVGKASKCPENIISVDPFALIELDFFDCLFWFGLISTGIILIFYLSFFLMALKNRSLFVERVQFVLVFGFSMLAGHVIMSVNSGAIFAVVLADIYLKSKTNFYLKPK